MKKRLNQVFAALALLALSALNSQLSTAHAQGTAFTYQGRLNTNAVPANGLYDFEFSLSNAPSGGSQIGSTLTQTGIGVTNGLFTANLNFGAVFSGNSTWLAISVRSNGVGSYVGLTPLQELNPTPYAIFANTSSNVSGTLPVTQLTGTIALAQLPPGLVTNDEGGVTLSNLTLQGLLTLPLPANIFAGGNSLLIAPENNNFYAGPSAGISNGTGGANTGLGAGSLNSNTNGTNNTAVGYQTLNNNTNGSYNVAIGERTLFQNLSGNDNTAEGRHALENNINGTDNTANGFQALLNNNGSYNTADGSSALSSIMAGSYNIALGYLAGNNYGEGESSNILIGSLGVGGDNNLIRIGSGQTQTYIAGVINGNGSGLSNILGGSLINNYGSEDFFAGQSAGNQTMTGAFNTGVGDDALSINISGGNNTALGFKSLWQNTNGGDNTALGSDSMAFNSSGSDNTGLGFGALEYNTTGSFNTGTGAYALSAYNTLYVTGDDNTADGAYALGGNESGFQNTGIGYGALAGNTTGSYNTATGVGALGNNNAADNSAFGDDALAENTSGTYNVALGSLALFANTNGNYNTATGYGALLLSDSGNDNTANGYFAMGATVSSSSADTAIGGYALFYSTANYNNTAVGYQALEGDTSGVDNLGLGVATLQSNEVGSANTACGTYSLQNMTSGNGNIALGYSAGGGLVSGSDNIYIGNGGAASDNNVIRIGSGQSATYLTGTVNCGAITSAAHTCCSLTITGGCDLAEPFPISTPDQRVSEGAVVVIDAKNPGQLKLADRPYDTHVAGVVSGANGINPGIQMEQQGLMEGGKNVALTGRVYVQADASNGAIEPGDLLTTSTTPGRAMKVTDHLRAQGAILGKAMTGLSEGNGMVLVLVTLQ
jgi:hypothetical protein